MENFINDIERLLKLRREATDPEEKAVIDRAIDALIAERSRSNYLVYNYPSCIPPAPIWSTTPVTCKIQ